MRRRLALGAGALLVALGIAAAVVLTRGNGPKETVSTAPRVQATERVQDLAARVPEGRRVSLRTRPGGPVLATVGARTVFGSPQTMAVALRRGAWIAVRNPALGNRRLGWTEAATLRLVRRPLWIEVDLSRRKLTVVSGRSRQAVSVAVGSPKTPTPTGQFYVTDKLGGADFGPYYGCCILALSGRQPHLPRGWSGGDRLAIHGSPTQDAGLAVTNGCLHLPDDRLRALMRIVPLGTLVSIHE